MIRRSKLSEWWADVPVLRELVYDLLRGAGPLIGAVLMFALAWLIWRIDQ